MNSWLAKRRLKATGLRLRNLRAELAQLDEQIVHFQDEQDHEHTRALVSDRPDDRVRAHEASRHAEAHRRHRQSVCEEIASLERRQDQLLDAAFSEQQ